LEKQNKSYRRKQESKSRIRNLNKDREEINKEREENEKCELQDKTIDVNGEINWKNFSKYEKNLQWKEIITPEYSYTYS
jgi:hypothetical protein